MTLRDGMATATLRLAAFSGRIIIRDVLVCSAVNAVPPQWRGKDGPEGSTFTQPQQPFASMPLAADTSTEANLAKSSLSVKRVVRGDPIQRLGTIMLEVAS
jgi:hypothetical protein